MTSFWYVSFFLNDYSVMSPIFNVTLFLPMLFIVEVMKQLTFIFSNAFKILIFKTNIVNSIVFAIKFLLLISILIFIRGGVPRYRYDFLTKIGWIKFLSMLLFIFLSILLSNYIF